MNPDDYNHLFARPNEKQDRKKIEMIFDGVPPYKQEDCKGSPNTKINILWLDRQKSKNGLN